MRQHAPSPDGRTRAALRRRYQSVGLFLQYLSRDGTSPPPMRDRDDPQVPPPTPLQVVRIEEDWELVITDQAPFSEPPHILTVFGPTDPNWGAHALFELRPGALPPVVDDTAEHHCWWNEGSVRDAPAGEERITFTTSISIKASALEMAVIRGHSSGGRSIVNAGRLSIAVNTDRTNLNNHHADESLVHTRVAAGAESVRHFARTTLRRHTADGQVLVDHQRRIIHPAPGCSRAAI